MKNIKNIMLKSSIILFVLCFVLGLHSCVDDFRDTQFNYVYGSTADSVADIATAEGMMLAVMTRIHDTGDHQFQYQFNLHIDNYAGYLCVANNLEGRLPSSYFMNLDFEKGPLSSYLMIIRQLVPVINSAEALDFPEMGAIANIIFCFSTQEYVDVHGPMPYFDYRKLKPNPPMEYVGMKEVYYDLFEQLKESVEILKNANIDAEKQKVISTFDKIARGDIQNWIKFANTLRLRLAMHIRKVEPEKARLEAESAVADGVLQVNDGDIEIQSLGKQHPLYVISHTWDDTRLNASFENILRRLESPLLNEFFEANNQPLIDKNDSLVISDPYDSFMGIRLGTSVFNKLNNKGAYLAFSRIHSNYASRPMYIMKAVEAHFLRAEGALYGWNMGGTAEAFYQEAIHAVFAKEMGSEWGPLYADLYLSLETPRDITYIDYYDRDNDFDDEEYLVSVGNKWNNSYSNEQKLEQIITQKYIANFPLSTEAWTDIRRTGYPRQIPRVYDAGDNSSRGGIIRRIPFVLIDTVDPQDVYSTGIPALNEETQGDVTGDYQGTRLWWDVPVPNF